MKPYPAFAVPKRLLLKPNRESCLSGAAREHLRNLTDSLVFLYLRGGASYWVYLRAVRRGALEGYALRGSRWRPFSAPLAAVAAYY